jgi:hypothetical protein
MVKDQQLLNWQDQGIISLFPFVLEALHVRGLKYFYECRVLKVRTRSRSPVSGLLLEKDSVQVSGSKGSPVLTSKIPNSFVEGKPASRSPSMRQNMPEVLFLFFTALYSETHFLLC